MPGSPGGLARIDALFGSQTYTATFTASPLVFGAFPSLHSACATLQAFFLSHFFPRGRPFYWLYTFWMWWCTMYLTHRASCASVSSAADLIYAQTTSSTWSPAASSPPSSSPR
jgi:hypothetical protein